MLDVARAVLAEFPDEIGRFSSTWAPSGLIVSAITGDSSAGPEKLEGPMSELSAEESLVAFVDGLHTRRESRRTCKPSSSSTRAP